MRAASLAETSLFQGARAPLRDRDRCLLCQAAVRNFPHTGKMCLQSFSNAVHPLWRSYDHKVAHIFRAEDDDWEPRSPLIVPQRPVDRVRCYPPLDKNGSDKNGERLYYGRCAKSWGGPSQAYRCLSQSKAEERLLVRPGLSTFWHNDNNKEICRVIEAEQWIQYGRNGQGQR